MLILSSLKLQVSGEYLVKNGISTFACSETQKFGHVTFFWNGNRSGYFDSKLETYLEVRNSTGLTGFSGK
jgi:2,3-bisphosphoglycerate-independent phosphoglycerate mutase